MIKYKKSTVDHSIYIEYLSDVTVYYLKLSIDDVLNTTNNDTAFPELTSVFEEHFEIIFQEGSILKYQNFLICQSPLGFSIDHNDHIMELVNE